MKESPFSGGDPKEEFNQSRSYGVYLHTLGCGEFYDAMKHGDSIVVCTLPNAEQLSSTLLADS